MPEEADIQEIKEGLERLEHGHHEGPVSWNKYLALTTALIAVIAALATLRSGNLVNQALLAKNDAVLLQTKASDQYNYYQAKGIKKNLAEFALAMGKPKPDAHPGGTPEARAAAALTTSKEDPKAVAKTLNTEKKGASDGGALGKEGGALASGEVERYGREQEEIKEKADELIKQADESNVKSTELLENHHQAALSVTFFQISIALAAMSALLKRQSFWFFSMFGGALGVVFFTLSYF